ncbi:BRO family protein [Aetokthonos hydrillicola]|nr:DNA-damage-inducible protein [Aetokthonos hydrillicola CCALA 1050]
MTTLTNFQAEKSPFDQIRQVDIDGNEYWLARQLQPLLGYTQWRRFEETIERAKLACQNSGYVPENHFADAGNVVKRPQKGGSRQADYKLSRHGCYLTAMNGDPRKPEIAAAQNYFAVKTREAEVGSQIQQLVTQLLEKVQRQDEAIATLQSQISNLLPPDNSYAPPGWDAEVWRQLPPQDKRHFRFLAKRRKFRPSNQGTSEPLALPSITVEQVKQQQHSEVEQLVGEVSSEEKARVEAAKQDILARFWAEGGES